jgi:hypothetical protein
MSAIRKLRNRFLVLVLFVTAFIRLAIGRVRTGLPSSESRVASRGLLVETPQELSRTGRLLELRGRTPYFHFVPRVSRAVRLSKDDSGSFDFSGPVRPATAFASLDSVRRPRLWHWQRREGRLFAIRRSSTGARVGLQVTAQFPYLRVVPVPSGTVQIPVQLTALTSPALPDTADLRAFSISPNGAVLRYVNATVMPVVMSSSCPSSSSSCWSCSSSSSSSSCSSCSSSFCSSCSSCASCSSCGSCGSCGGCSSCGSCGGCSSCGGCGSCGGCSSCEILPGLF